MRNIKYLPQMPGESQRRHLFVVIDQATRGVFVQIQARRFVLWHCRSRIFVCVSLGQSSSH
jgi:hypothetical protein